MPGNLANHWVQRCPSVNTYPHLLIEGTTPGMSTVKIVLVALGTLLCCIRTKNTVSEQNLPGGRQSWSLTHAAPTVPGDES